MRGSLLQHHTLRQHSGIIPAHAGLTATSRVVGVLGGDHPRACGAHCIIHGRTLPSGGSSPRMRGSRLTVRGNDGSYGIIPAHAGLTTFLWLNQDVTRDHPRACGAHDWCPQKHPPPMGSSPRMRGSHVANQSIGYEIGIIPAHAGLTAFTNAVYPSAGDHPRACGAHTKKSQY